VGTIVQLSRKGIMCTPGLEELRTENERLQAQIARLTAENTALQAATERQAEATRLESDGRTAAILEGIADAFYALDDQWRFVIVNPAAERAPFGRPASELIGKVIWDVFPAIVGTRIHQHYLDAVEKRSREHYEARSPLNGHWYEVSMFPRPQGLDVYLRDIDDRKRAEQALGESEERFRLALKHAPVSVAAQDRELRYIWAYGQRTARPDEVVGKLDADLFTAEEAARLEAVKRRVLAENVEHREQMWLDRPGGRMFLDIYFEPVRDEAGQTMGVGIATVDLTPMKLAEEALGEEKDRLSALVNSIDDEVWFADTQRRFTMANASALREFRLESGEMGVEELAASLEVYRPDGSPRPVAETPPLRALAGEVVRNEEELVRTPAAGDLRHRQVSCSPVKDALGNVIGSVSVVRDITELRRAEEALRQQRRELEIRVTSEVAARDALRETRDYLESLLGYANAPIIVWDPSLRITRFNRAFERLTGYRAQEVIGRELQLLFPRASREASLAKIMRTSEGEHWESVEIPIRRKDGEERLALWNSANVRAEDGERIIATIAQGQDITQRKQAEDALRASEERLRLALTAGRMGTWDWHVPSGDVIWNEEHFRMLGYEPGSVAPSYQAWAARVHPDDRAAAESLVHASVARGGEYNHEFRSLASDGTVRWVEARGRMEHDAAGQPLRQYGVMLDITDRKRAEEALRLSEERLRAHIDNSPMAVVEFDPEFQVTRWSQQAEHLFGWTADEILGRRIADMRWVYEEDVESVGAESAGLLSGERPRSVNVNRNYRKDGAIVHCEWYDSALYDAQGRLISILALVRDITERKRAEEEREQHLAAIEEANEAKDLFFNTLSHELRTPLAAMQNAVEVLKNREASAAQRARLTNLLERNIRHQTRLIDDLLDLSRIMRKKVELVRQALDLGQLVVAQVEGVEVSARKARLALETSTSEQRVLVSADPERLGQVISNLLTNAIKYTEPGGVITARVAADGDQATVRVKDTGIGIAPELLPHVFEAFRQAETSLARSKGGLGIGLAVARSLAELHGGTLDGASDGPGRGSEFTLRLPLCTDDAASLRAGDAVEGRCNRMRVLVVEDGADLLESMIILLELMGHTVIAAADGRAAIELAKRERPDAALIDIGLPDMDGYDVARALRREPALTETRLVALTGYATPEHRARALAAGFDHHLAKPVAMEDLQRALQSQGRSPTTR
jgi:PAS domain S-box-containing protein